MTTGRLISYFAVYGLPEDSLLIPMSRTHDTTEIQHCNAITGLRLVLSPGIPCQTSPLSTYMALCKGGEMTLWLEITYGRKGNETQSDWKPGEKAISWVSFYYLSVEGNAVKVPIDCDYVPVPVCTSASDTHNEQSVSTSARLYTGSYDLTQVLQAQAVPGHHLAMVCRYSTSEPAIAGFALVTTSIVPRPEGGFKRIAVIPHGYEQVKFLLGRDQSAILCYKRQPEALSIVFQSCLLQQFPTDDSTAQLVKATASFAFPSGISLSTRKNDVRIHSYILTSAPGQTNGRLYVTCLTFWEPVYPGVLAGLNLPMTTIYAPKAICLSSKYAYIENCGELLRHIYKSSLASDSPLEGLIASVMDIPEPDRGSQVQYPLPDTLLTFTRPGVTSLWPIPQCTRLFTLLRPETVLQIWSCLMLERKVVLHSSDISVLTPVTVALTSLLYPYHWNHILVPVLPDSLSPFLETVVPYLIGTASASLLAQTPPEAVIVYLDTGTIHSSEPLLQPSTPLSKRLLKRLKPLSSLYHRETPDSDLSLPVQNAFLHLQCQLIQDYTDYMDLPSPGTTGTYINLPQYIDRHKGERFLGEFLQTGLFAGFIEDRGCSGERNQTSRCFDAAMRFQWGKKGTFLTQEVCKQTLVCHTIEEKHLEKCQIERFPTLKEENWPKSHSTPSIIPDFPVISTEIWAQTILGSIYSLWFLLAASFPQSTFHVDQVISLLVAANRAKIPINEFIYEKLTQACGREEAKPQVLRLFKCMKSLGVHPDPYYYSLYIQSKGKPPVTAVETTNLSDFLVEIHGKCPECSRENSLEEVLLRLNRDSKQTNCTCVCRHVFVPRLTLTSLQGGPTQELALVSPLEALELLNAVESDELQTTVSRSEALKWSLCLYFTLAQLPVLTQKPSLVQGKKQFLSKIFRRKSASSADFPSVEMEGVTEEMSPLRMMMSQGFGRFERETEGKRAFLRESQVTLADLGTEPGEIVLPQLPLARLKLTIL